MRVSSISEEKETEKINELPFPRISPRLKTPVNSSKTPNVSAFTMPAIPAVEIDGKMIS